MASGEAPDAPDSIVFLGDTKHEVSIEEDDITTNDNFTQVMLTGEKSVYIVYDVPNLSTGYTPEKLQVVTCTDPVALNFTPRSTKGHSKEGIILFETFNYGGESQCYIDDSNDVTAKFPPGPAGEGKGISSFMVYSGTWQLFKGLNQSDGPILINGKDKFGPDTTVDLHGHLSLNDSIKSIKKVGV